jgi:hypothetical protein
MAFTAKFIHALSNAQENMKIRIFVMPAWSAGIQIRKDASGYIHITLVSSTPCWNDGIKEYQ